MKKQNLQKIRTVVITISTVLFPFTFYYLSPAIPLGGSTMGILSGSLVVFAVLFVLSMFLGRTFCSWVCPAGGIQDQIGQGRTKKVPVKKINWMKYAVWGIWLAGLLYFFREAGGIKEIRFAYQTEHGLSTTSFQSLVVYGMVVLTFIILSLVFGRRTGCHTICWISPFMILGRKIGLALPLPSLHLKTLPETCVDCSFCRTACPMSLNVPELVRDGKITDDDCILCGKCLTACRKETIAWAWRKE